MLTVGSPVKVYLYCRAADLRRGYDGLASIVQSAMQQDPLSGSLFVFVNKRGNRIKILYWDRDGYAIWMKRLERGTLKLPQPQEENDSSVKITASQLAMILEGLELSRVRRRNRYTLPQAG